MEEFGFGKMKSKAKTLLYYYIHKRNGQPFDKEKMEELLAFYETSEKELENLIVLAIEEGNSRSDMHRGILENSLNNALEKIFRKGTEEERNEVLLILIGFAFCSSVTSGGLKLKPIDPEKRKNYEL